MALPTASYTDIRYFVSATASDGSEANPGTVDSTNHTFTIALPLGKVWTVKLGMQKKESTDADYKTVLEGTYAFDHELTAADAATPITIVLAPISTGTGNIDLDININTDLCKFFEIGVFSEPVAGEWETKYSDYGKELDVAYLTDGTYKIELNGITSGTHKIELVFRNTAGIDVYSCTQIINVFQNMTTNKWFSEGGLSAIASDGTFAITDTLVEAYARTQIYVGATPVKKCNPNDDNQGSAYEPLETLNAAISRMTDSTKDYTIRIYGEQKGNFTLGVTDEVAPNFAAHSVTLCGMTGNTTDILNGDKDNDGTGDGTVLTITTTAPVTIRNLKITGGFAHQGGGINATIAESNITLENGALITGNTAEIQGGGMYVYGAKTRLVMNEGSKISQNHVTGSNADYGGLGVYIGCDSTTTESNYPTFTLNGGEISGHSCGSTGAPAGSIKGMGIMLGYAKLVMNGGKITENGAVSNNGDNTLGGNIYADHSKIEINSGEISKGSIKITNYYASAGGIWLAGSSTLTMTGGKIIENYVSPGGVHGGNGGAIVLWDSSSIEITGGEISGNYIDTNNSGVQSQGGAIHVAANGGTVKIGDSAYIPYGVDGETGAGKNDIFLSSGKTVTIAGALTGNSPVAAITLVSPSDELTVLEKDTNASAADFAAACKKFAVSNTGYILGSDGKLKLGVVTTPANAAESISNITESSTVVLNGTITSDNLTDIKNALTELQTSSPSTKVTLDLSGVTGIDAIPANAFSNCTNLESISLPDCVKSIGGMSFYLCGNLKSVTLPQNLETIGSNSFLGCNFTEIEIPSSVTSIGATAFAQCKFTSITIPASVTSIDYGVFSKCESLTSLTVEEGNSNYVAEGNVLYTKNKDKIVSVAAGKTGEFTIPETVTAIEKNAFTSSKLTSITIPNNVTSIGSSAFENCSNLTSIEIPSSLTVLDYYLFSNCTSLASVNLPNTLTELMSSAFQNCSKLTSVEIPANVTSIGTNAFSSCTKLESITLNHSNSALTIANNAFNNCNQLSTVNYIGTEEQRNARSFTISDTGNSSLINATWNYASFTGTAYTQLPAGTTDGSAGTSGTYVLFGDWPTTIKEADVTVYETTAFTVGDFSYSLGSDGAWYCKIVENPYFGSNTTYSNGTKAHSKSDNVESWFKVEPIKWRVVSNNFDGGKKLLVAENVFHSCQFYDSYDSRGDVKSNNYKESRIRAYLNGYEYNQKGTTSSEFVGKGFINTAFMSSLQGIIVTTTVKNGTESGAASGFECEDTEDKLFLLSKAELQDTTLFSSGVYSKIYCTDFALANSISQATSTQTAGETWIRTPSGADCTYRPSGSTFYESSITNGSMGIVPALCINN